MRIAMTTVPKIKVISTVIIYKAIRYSSLINAHMLPCFLNNGYHIAATVVSYNHKKCIKMVVSLIEGENKNLFSHHYKNVPLSVLSKGKCDYYSKELLF
jgi:hypothetical protein